MIWLEDKKNWLFEIKKVDDHTCFDDFAYACGECKPDGNIAHICYVHCFTGDDDGTFWIQTTNKYGQIDTAECEAISEDDYIMHYNIFQAIICRTPLNVVREIFQGVTYFDGTSKIDVYDMTRDAKNMAVNRVH